MKFINEQLREIDTKKAEKGDKDDISGAEGTVTALFSELYTVLFFVPTHFM